MITRIAQRSNGINVIKPPNAVERRRSYTVCPTSIPAMQNVSKTMRIPTINIQIRGHWRSNPCLLKLSIFVDNNISMQCVFLSLLLTEFRNQFTYCERLLEISIVHCCCFNNFSKSSKHLVGVMHVFFVVFQIRTKHGHWKNLLRPGRRSIIGQSTTEWLWIDLWYFKKNVIWYSVVLLLCKTWRSILFGIKLTDKYCWKNIRHVQRRIQLIFLSISTDSLVHIFLLH